MRKLFLTTLTVALATATLSTPARAESLADAVPGDAFVYVSVSNVESLISKLKSSPIWNITKDPEIAPLIAEIEQGWAAAKQGASSEVGVDLEKLLGSIRGEVALVVGDLKPLAGVLAQSLSTFEEPEITPEMIPILIAVDTAAGKSDFEANWSKLVEFGKKSGVTLEESSVGGGKLTTIGRPADASEGPEKIFFGESGSHYLIGLNKDLVQKTLSGLGTTTTVSGLSSNALFKASLAKTGGSHGDMLVYANLASLRAAVDQALSASMFAFFWQKFQGLLVGTSLNNIVVTTSLGADGLSQKAFIHNAGADDGFLGWLKTTPMSPRPSPLIPENAQTFSSMGLNGGKILAAIKEIAATVMAFQGAQMDIDTMVEQQMGIKLSDLERSLGDRVHTFQSEGSDPSNPAGDLSVVMELEDAGPMKALLERIALLSQGALSTEKYLNRDLYSADSGMGFTPTFVASDKLFIFSMSKGNVEKVIQRIGKESSPIAESENFKKHSSMFPAKVAGISYSNETFLKSTFEGMAEALQMGSPPDVPPALFKLIGAFGGTIGTSLSYSQWQAEGFYTESKTFYAK